MLNPRSSTYSIAARERAGGSAWIRPGLINPLALGLAVFWVLALFWNLDPLVDDMWHYWNATQNMLRSGNPYVPLDAGFLYPPIFAYLAQPLGWFSYATARLVWFGLNAVMMCAWGLLAIHLSGSQLARRWWGAVLFLLLISPAARITLQLGQLGALLLVLIGSAHLAARRHPNVTGVLLALATGLKLYPALIVVAYLLRRHWRIVTATAGAGAAMLALSAAVYGLQPYRDYMQGVLLARQPYSLAEYNISLSAFWTRLLSTHDYGIAVTAAPLLARVLTSISSMLVLLVSWRSTTEARVDGGSARFLAVWLCAMGLLSPINGIYNLVVVLLPALVILRHLEGRYDRRRLVGLALALLLCSIPAGWSDNLPALYSFVHTGWGLLLLTPPLYGLVLMFVLVARLPDEPAVRAA